MKSDLIATWNRNASLPAAPEYVQEDAWVTSSQRGDALAFNRLVLKWENKVYNLALRMLQHPEEAAEATQEIFLSAYKSIRRFRRDARFSTWLYRIALNHCISRARRRPQGANLSLDDGSQGAAQADRLRAPDSQEGELLRAENRKRVRGALVFLPPEQRAVVELKFFQEMTFDDIAVILEVPLSTIKSRLYAALDSLKVRLGERA
jgi:RNA polymerase sigma-70 factor (ECF subfamily)